MIISTSGKYWLIFAAGVASAIIFAGPVIGLAWGTFTITRHATGGNTVYASAHRLYLASRLRRFETVDLPSVDVIRIPSDCETIQKVKMATGIKPLQKTISDLNSAVSLGHKLRIGNAEDFAVENAISKMSTWKLGSLEGCMNASLLVPWCESYINRIRDRAMLSENLRQRLAAVERDTERVWCFLAHQNRNEINQRTPSQN